jgi:hypothetical protein
LAARACLRNVEGPVDREQVRQHLTVLGERVRPAHGHRLAAPHDEGRTGIGALVAKERRRQRAMRDRIHQPHPAAKLPHADLLVPCPRNRRRPCRAWQAVHELRLAAQVEQRGSRFRSRGAVAKRRQNERCGE